MDTLERPQNTVTHYTYRVAWSAEDDEFVATVAEFPSLSWLDTSQIGALEGLRAVLADVVRDMTEQGEEVPDHCHSAATPASSTSRSARSCTERSPCTQPRRTSASSHGSSTKSWPTPEAAPSTLQHVSHLRPLIRSAPVLRGTGHQFDSEGHHVAS